MNTAPALAIALRESAKTVARVAAGRSLAEKVQRPEETGAESLRAAVLDITHGTLRRFGRVQAIVRALSRQGRAEALTEALLWCSLYALESGRYAQYTAVDQAVKACEALHMWRAKGYVNAVLRAWLRERGSLEARIAADPQARFQHPHWWIDLLRAAYPSRWEEILAAGNSHPPMCLRVNRRRGPVDKYLQRLAEAGIAARRIGEDGLLLEHPAPVHRLPGFSEGEVSVQDAGAQRAAHCLDLSAGQRVLDACAAPGGKAAHILESADVALTALDADPVRCARLRRNFERLGLRATVAAADCTRLAEWWNGVPFDRILADVPCSASGVVRRHPDIKWLRRAQDVTAFSVRQTTILDALWQALASNGKLLYVTCSVFPRENEEVIGAFLNRTPGARGVPLPDGAGAQWLPAADHDGFYYALIEKQA